MSDPKFSWTRAIGEVRSLVATSLDKGLCLLREYLERHPLQGFELELVGRLLRDVPGLPESSFPEIRVAILASYTSDPLANAVRVALLVEGHRGVIYEAPYGTYRQEIIADRSGMYEFKPNIVLVAVNPSEILDAGGTTPGPETASGAVERLVDEWRTLWSVLARRTNGVIFQHTLDAKDAAYLGVAERRISWSPRRLISDLNDRLLDTAPAAVKWVDVEALSARVGHNNWHDPRLALHGKFGFSARYLPEYARLLGSVVRNQLGRGHKALIVDLDNTLWGGVIGDDGMSGIRLGPGTAEGEAYQAFCRYLAGLGRRGVILGICSKNEMANVTEVFEQHPHISLTLDDFSVVRCNWDDKASNLRAIAEELNIDLSALVFVDDNPAECELVRQRLPAVRVINLDGDPAYFVRRLDDEYLFESQRYLPEDLKRAASYRARRQSAKLQALATDLDAYLRSLEMRGELWLAQKEDIGRLAQMEGKTNQFNVTTRRWNSDQIEDFLQSKSHDVLCFRLADRFADHGLVGSMIVSYSSDEARILSWLLSCRVFSRTCEEFMLAGLLRRAAQKQAKRIVGEYVATPKNRVVESLFVRLGFAPTYADSLFDLSLPVDALPKSFIAEGSVKIAATEGAA